MKKLFFFAITLLASPLWEEGRGLAQTANEPGSGNALGFDGVSNYVHIPDANNLSFTNTLSIEAWFSTNQIGIAHRIVGKEQVGSIYPEYFILMNADGTMQFGINSGNFDNIQRITTDSAYNDGKYHHVTGTYDGSFLKIYIDGIQEGNLATSIVLWNSSTPLLIGSAWGATNTTYTWQGQIDEVRIWNRALTQTEIQQNMCRKLADCADPTLVGYWRFDEGVDNTCPGGQDVCDASCNGNHGTKF